MQDNDVYEDDEDEFTLPTKRSSTISISHRRSSIPSTLSEGRDIIIISKYKDRSTEKARRSISDSKVPFISISNSHNDINTPSISTNIIRRSSKVSDKDVKEIKPRVLKNRSLESDLKTLNIPDIIKEKANEMYMRFLESSPKKSFRKLSKDAIKFAFIFKAYYSMNIPVDTHEIIRRMGITEKVDKIIKKGMNISFTEEDGIREDKQFTSIQMIPGYLNIFGLPSEWSDDISVLYASLEYFEESLISSNKPQVVAIGLIYFYSTYVMKMDIDKKNLCIETNSSQGALNKVYNALLKIMCNTSTS